MQGMVVASATSDGSLSARAAVDTTAVKAIATATDVADTGPRGEQTSSREAKAAEALSSLSTGQLVSSEQLGTLLESTIPVSGSLNDDNIVYAFGYGSGVFAQKTEQTNTGASSLNDDRVNKDNVDTVAAVDTPRVDLIVVVRDALAFHKKNIKCNPTHYPLLVGKNSRRTHSMHSTEQMADMATWIQRHAVPLPRILNGIIVNPKLYFCVTETLKYGIVQVDDVVDADLRHWSYLYLAGRLHKPVVDIFLSNNQSNAASLELREQFQNAQQQYNLPAALSTALLLDWNHRRQDRIQRDNGITKTITNVDVYQRIASISYLGDPRMAVAAEDPHKVRNLVSGSMGQVARFDALYQPSIQALVQQGILNVSSDHVNSDTKRAVPIVQTWSWDDTNPLAHERLWQNLPPAIRTRCLGPEAPSFSSTSTAAAATIAHAAQALPKVIASIVAPAARYQSVKGLVTAGFGPSIQYVYRKLSKGLLRQR